MLKSRVIAVTGGAGFIGGHLVDVLLSDPAVSKIYVLDKNPPRQSTPRVEFIYCDITAAIQFVPETPINTCYHLAAVCREPGYEWNEYFSVNYAGTRNVCEWASVHGIENIVFTSTVMVFSASDLIHRESDIPNADTAYGLSKALAEEALRGWQAAMPNRRLSIVRPGVVFGVGCDGNFIKLYKALRLGLFFYIGRNTTIKSCIYVKDLIGILTFASVRDVGVRIYHAVYPDPISIKEICEEFCKVFGWRRVILTIPYRLALAAALIVQGLNYLGVKNSIHYRRIQKLYFSTNLSSECLYQSGFSLAYSFRQALRDWKLDCKSGSLH